MENPDRVGIVKDETLTKAKQQTIATLVRMAVEDFAETRDELIIQVTQILEPITTESIQYSLLWKGTHIYLSSLVKRRQGLTYKNKCIIEYVRFRIEIRVRT